MQIIRGLYEKVRFILTNLAKHVAIHGDAHLCDVISEIPHADLPCGVGKIQRCWIFYPRGNSPARGPYEWEWYMYLMKAR